MAFKFNPFTGNLDDVADVAEKLSGAPSSTDNAIVRFDGVTGKIIQDSGVTIDDSNNVIIPGNLTVNGTTTTINTTNLEVTDNNILINDGGNDVSAEGAGITIERAGTNGSIVYEDALTSKFKIGALGSEGEIVTVSSSQTLSGKSIDAGSNNITNLVNGNVAAAAAISLSKLAALNTNIVPVSDGSGFLTNSAVTATELGHVSGVTSAIQTQLDGKATGAASSTDNAVARFDATTGKIIQNSLVLIDDAGAITGPTGLQFSTGVNVASILDEDNMASDSATALATQQSIKAYVDSSVAAGVFDVISINSGTVATANKTYLADTTSGGFQITLPASAANVFIRVKDAEGTSESNNITIVGAGGENIDNAGAYVINSAYESVTLVCDGSEWFIL